MNELHKPAPQWQFDNISADVAKCNAYDGEKSSFVQNDHDTAPLKQSNIYVCIYVTSKR